MPRRNRVHIPGGIYHVVLRGNAKEPVFFCDRDRQRLNELIAEGLERSTSRLHAYCWMTNHIHAAIQVSDRPLSELMCWLASRYARFLNRRRKRTGHVFERRYRAMLVTDDSYLLSLVRYIHLNPVKAGLAATPAQYRWSSHRAYCGHEHPEWVSTRAVLSCFADSILSARRQYQHFMQADHDWTPSKDEPADIGADCALMTDELVVQQRSDASNDQRIQDLARLVEELCAANGLDPAVLSRPGRQRHPARVRAIISHRAIVKGIATLAELAFYFHRAPEVISRGIGRYCAAQIDEGNNKSK